jgi:hypothetical protein
MSTYRTMPLNTPREFDTSVVSKDTADLAESRHFVCVVLLSFVR